MNPCSHFGDIVPTCSPCPCDATICRCKAPGGSCNPLVIPLWKTSQQGVPKAVIETVDHPAHYIAGGVEAITVIEAWDLNFSLGSVIKYIARLGRKTLADGAKLEAIEDLRKARRYIDFEIARLSGSRAAQPAQPAQPAPIKFQPLSALVVEEKSAPPTPVPPRDKSNPHKHYAAAGSASFLCGANWGSWGEGWETITCPNCLAKREPEVQAPVHYWPDRRSPIDPDKVLFCGVRLGAVNHTTHEPSVTCAGCRATFNP